MNHPHSSLGGLGRSLRERSKLDPGPAPAWGNSSKKLRGLCSPCWQLAHGVTHMQDFSSSKDHAPRRARLKVPTSLLLEGSILLLSPQQGCSGLGSAAGAAGHLNLLLQSLDFKAIGGKSPRLRNTRGARAPEPVQPLAAGVVRPVGQAGNSSTEQRYWLLEDEAGNCSKDKTSEILI